ncbi:MAG TPA: DUF3617 family protein [Terracidiphilus sp.]|nr:DUF3617 family protein [Terracidiphilus sp.]
MNVRRPAKAAFPILFAAFAFVATAQLSEAPPVTMGLWQTETTSTVTGVENTPMAGMAAAMGRDHATQACLTAEHWRSDIQGFNARMQHNCTLSNVHQDAHEVSFDEACQESRGGANSTHVDILIDSAEHAHGTVVMKMSDPNLPQPMTVTVNMTSHYLGSDCGGIKPGDSKMIR